MHCLQFSPAPADTRLGNFNFKGSLQVLKLLPASGNISLQIGQLDFSKSSISFLLLIDLAGGTLQDKLPVNFAGNAPGPPRVGVGDSYFQEVGVENRSGTDLFLELAPLYVEP